MTILRQIGLAVAAVALMVLVAPSVPAGVYVVACCGGFAVSRYDDGATGRRAAGR